MKFYQGGISGKSHIYTNWKSFYKLLKNYNRTNPFYREEEGNLLCISRKTKQYWFNKYPGSKLYLNEISSQEFLKLAFEK